MKIIFVRGKRVLVFLFLLFRFERLLGFPTELGLKLVNLGTEGRDLPLGTVVDFVRIGAYQVAHVAGREGAFAVHLLLDVLGVGLKDVREGSALDADVLFTVGVLVVKPANGLHHQPVKVLLHFGQGGGSSARDGDVNSRWLCRGVDVHGLVVVLTKQVEQVAVLCEASDVRVGDIGCR